MSKRPTKEESVAALMKPLAPMSSELEMELNWKPKAKKAITIKRTLKGASLPMNNNVESVVLAS